jgi:hypothetical protein
MRDRYPEEVLTEDEDCGTMPENVNELRTQVVGHRIVKAEREGRQLWITLDSGKQVILNDTDDCCAYTSLEDFFLEPDRVNHVILGVGTTDKYTTWHIYADFGDVMQMKVGWSPGNPFYYGYGFSIQVMEPSQ